MTIYANLDDIALQAAAEEAAGRFANAMGYRLEPPHIRDEANRRFEAARPNLTRPPLLNV